MAPRAAPAVPVTDLPALIAETRARLREGQQQLRANYERNGVAAPLLHGRARLVDQVLRDVW